MRSVADDLREADAAAVAAMTPEERMALARALGDRCVAVFAEAQGLSEEDARAELRRRRQIGRTPSACARARG